MKHKTTNPAHQDPRSLNRRALLRTSAEIAVISAALGCGVSFGADTGGGDVIVETDSGRLRGARRKGVASFKGIPYGGSTAGARRWQRPVKPTPWSGVRDALDYGPRAPQSDGDMTGMLSDEVSNLVMGEPAGYTRKPISEDCLVLNVWTPSTSDHRKRPVMFWCHGGGFFVQSPDVWWYDGTNLSRTQDVVVVTVNHRLGALGYLNLEELGGSEYADSGNVGMLDLVRALEWVRDNITVFGGDPNNVTIFGESGGGAKVSTLLAMPVAKGLFHKAIIESGAILQANTREVADSTAQAVISELGIRKDDISKLQNVPLEKILSVQTSLLRKSPMDPKRQLFAPFVDGKILPQNPFDPVAPSISAHVPLIVGTNKNEATALLSKIPNAFALSESEMHQMARMSFGPQADEMITGYRKANPQATPTDIFMGIATFEMMRAPSITLAERKSAQNAAPVYMYLFAYESDVMDGKLKSPHGLEIPFVFDNVDTVRYAGSKPDRFALAKQVSGAWAAFARSGNPRIGGVLWKPYRSDERATMIINTESKLVNDPEREERISLG